MKYLSKFISDYLTPIFVVLILAVVAVLAVLATPNEDGTRTFDGNAPTYTDEQKQAACEVKERTNKEILALSGVDVPQDASSGCAPTDLPQMGAMPYYKVDVSTPQAFVNSVNGRGFNEGYGLQCVAGFKEFMYSLSGKYVATKTGGASGYAQQQAQIEPLGFKWHSGTAGLQNGDWAIWGTGKYGHVAMYYNGQWFGQNQNAANSEIGNAFNLSNVGTAGILGYYRPNIYVKSTPAPTPTPTPAPNTSAGNGTSSTSNSYTVRRGDTLGGIALKNGWYSGVNGLYGDTGYAQRLADENGIQWRGLILPGQNITRVK